MRIAHIYILLALYISFCSSHHDSQTDCDFSNNKSAEFLFEFRLHNDSAKLDSAITIIDKALKKCTNYNKLLFLRKLTILSLQRKYLEGYKNICLVDTVIIPSGNYRNILTNRFMAMNFNYQNDTIKRNEKINQILKSIYIEEIKQEHDLKYLLSIDNIDEILNTSLNILIVQKYYYRSILIGKSIVKSELKEMISRKILSNTYGEYLGSILDDDFNIFEGY